MAAVCVLMLLASGCYAAVGDNILIMQITPGNFDYLFGTTLTFNITLDGIAVPPGGQCTRTVTPPRGSVVVARQERCIFEPLTLLQGGAYKIDVSFAFGAITPAANATMKVSPGNLIFSATPISRSANMITIRVATSADPTTVNPAWATTTPRPTLTGTAIYI